MVVTRSPLKSAIMLFLILGLAATACGSDASQQPGPSDAPVFRTGARLVLVDVAAIDTNGKPVHGLKASDFAIWDSGEPQVVRSFEEHSSEETAKNSDEAEKETVPPGVYSNWAPKSASGATNIVLFDALNMNWQDQANARKSMIEYLKKLPPGQQIALFTLGDHLRMVQGFTGRTDTLIAAAKKMGGLTLLNSANVGLQSDQIAEMKGTLTPGMNDFGMEVLSRLENFLQEESNNLVNIRMEATLEALRELARSVGSIPGRKNLVWVSGSFPLQIGSATERSTPNLYDRELRKTAALLAAHQIAVYPIDARGLLTPVVGGERTGRAVTMAKEDDAAAGQKEFLNGFSQELMATHSRMDELAEQTGGRAFYNSNDIPEAIRTSIDSGANYYTLSYAPNNKRWDGELRKIEVKAARVGLKLTYRRGYYAIADPFAPVLTIKTTKVDVQQRLIEAVQPNAPQASGIVLHVSARAPSAKDQPVQIEYVIDARGLTLERSADNSGGRRLRYQLVAVAWDEKARNAAQAWQMVDEEIPAARVTELVREGIRSRRSIMLNPGSYNLYVGVIDVDSKKIGTVVIPLKIPKQVAMVK